MKIRISVIIASILMIVILPASVFSTEDADSLYHIVDDQTHVITAVKGGEVYHTYQYNPNEEVRIIVQFSSPPVARLLAGQHARGLKREQMYDLLEVARMKIQSEHDRFRNDLSIIESGGVKKSGLNPVSSTIRFEYQTVLNGMAVTTRRWVADEILNLPYVKATHPDAPVEAFVSNAAAVIEADYVRTAYGLTGDGIVVGILDTGIDYTHPALGGGVGPGYKVTGGKNFTTSDSNDFIDRHGHGTHVAGIVAASGGDVTGIAPEARLRAYKVLSDAGSGTQAGVIAGIEQAVLDGVHIMNLSLGGIGNPNDAGSQAIDNAMKAGVLCVIAAGNAANYFTIGSPGTARLGLTVGASNNNDQITSFSSRGPTALTYEMKPDIVAPGFQLNSTAPGGEYRRASGTSMAAPVVAGAAALYLEKYPGTDPLDLKAVFMNTAESIGQDVWTQGAGRLTVRKAIETEISITAGSSYFGIVDINDAQWTAKDTIIVRNNADQSVEVTLGVQPALPSGAQLDMQPNAFVLTGGEERSVILTLIVNPNLPLTSVPPGYTGAIVADVDGNAVRVPFAFIKSPIIDVTFDQVPAVLYIHDRDEFLRAYPSQHLATESKLLVPENTYDIVTLFRESANQTVTNHIVLKENIELNGYSALDIFKTDAEFDLVHTVVDINNNGIMPTSQYSVFDPQIGDIRIFFLGHIIHSLSGISNQYRFDTKIHSYNESDNTIYELPFELSSGIASDIVFENDPSEYQTLEIQYDGHLGQSERYWNWIYFTPTSVVGNVNEAEIASPFHRTFYYTPPPSADYYEWFTRREHLLAGINNNPIYLMPQITVTPDGDFVFYENSFAPDPVFETSDRHITHKLGASVPVWTGYTSNTTDIVQISRRTRGTDRQDGATGFFTDQFGGASQKDIPFRLKSGESLVEEGTLEHFVTLWQIPVAASEYVLDLEEFNYKIKNVHGEARALLSFDMEKTDKNPPYITGMKFSSDGIPTAIFDPAVENIIALELKDDEAMGAVSFYIRPLYGTGWEPLPFEQEENVYTAVIADTLPDGMYYSFRVVAEDVAGNTLDYTAKPAFHLTGDTGINLPAPVSLKDPADGATDIPLDQRLNWSPSQYAETYRLQIGYDADFASIFFDSTGIASIPFSAPLFEKNTVYYWRVNALNAAGESDWSPVWQFTSGTITDVREIADIPDSYSMSQNFPNPFNPSTTIRYALPGAGHVKLTVYNTLGQKVSTLIDSYQNAGYHEVVWFANVPSGVYFYRIEATSESDGMQRFVKLKRLVVLK